MKQEDLFIEHAALIMRQDLGTTVGGARFRAWCEGPEGYLKRLKREDVLNNDGEDE